MSWKDILKRDFVGEIDFTPRPSDGWVNDNIRGLIRLDNGYSISVMAGGSIDDEKKPHAKDIPTLETTIDDWEKFEVYINPLPKGWDSMSNPVAGQTRKEINEIILEVSNMDKAFGDKYDYSTTDPGWGKKP
jgi:hypothetical protein